MSGKADNNLALYHKDDREQNTIAEWLRVSAFFDKQLNRSLRRHHRQRLIRKRRNRIAWVDSDTNTGVLANTPCRCSCWMCGNPRRYSNSHGESQRTVQERKQYQETIEERLSEIMSLLELK